MDYSQSLSSLIFGQIINASYTILQIATPIICYYYFTQNKTRGTRILAWSSIAILVVPYIDSACNFLDIFLQSEIISDSIHWLFRFLRLFLRGAFIYGLYLVLKEYSEFKRKV